MTDLLWMHAANSSLGQVVRIGHMRSRVGHGLQLNPVADGAPAASAVQPSRSAAFARKVDPTGMPSAARIPSRRNLRRVKFMTPGIQVSTSRLYVDSM